MVSAMRIAVPESVSQPAKTCAAVALVPASVMLGLALWGLDRGTMWSDESATYQLAQRSVPEIRQLLASHDAVHGLYYLVVHYVLDLHASEVMLRLPSVLAAVGTAALVAATGHRLAGPRVGLWAGLLFAITPMVSHYAQEGRSYALVALGAALATFCLVLAVERSSFTRWVAYWSIVTVTALLHEFALLLLVAHGSTLLVAQVRRGVVGRWATAAGLATIVLLPLVLFAQGQIGQVSWSARPGVEELAALAREFAGPSAPVAAVVAVLVAVALLRPLPATGPMGLTAVALPLAALPPVLLYLASQREPVFLDRYLLFALPGVPLLVAAGLDRLGRWLPQRRAVAIAGVVAIAVALGWQLPIHADERSPGSRVDDLAPVAALVAAAARPGDGVVFLPSYERHVALSYPREFAGLHDVALRSTGAASGTLVGLESSPEQIRHRLESLDRVVLVVMPGSIGSEWLEIHRTESGKLAALHELFDVAGTSSVHSGTVTVYVRKKPGHPPAGFNSASCCR